MPSIENESFPYLDKITPENREKLEEIFGSPMPEQQPSFPGIDVSEGKLVVPELQIQTELLPEGKEIYFAWDPRDRVSIFTTSEGEVGFGVMPTLSDLQIDYHGGFLDRHTGIRHRTSPNSPEGFLCKCVGPYRLGPVGVSLVGSVTDSLLIQFEQSLEEYIYSLDWLSKTEMFYCSFKIGEEVTFPEEMKLTVKEGKKIILTEFQDPSRLEQLEFVKFATGFNINEIYVSNMIGDIVREKLDKNLTPAACVLMYLE